MSGTGFNKTGALPTYFSGATFFQVNNSASATVVAAGANVNGMLIPMIHIYARGGAASFIEFGAGNAVVEASTAASAPLDVVLTNCFIPPGNALIVGAGTAQDFVSGCYILL